MRVQCHDFQAHTHEMFVYMLEEKTNNFIYVPQFQEWLWVTRRGAVPVTLFLGSLIFQHDTATTRCLIILDTSSDVKLSIVSCIEHFISHGGKKHFSTF
ncbi:unnamed protein product [Boreogadus saida]